MSLNDRISAATDMPLSAEHTPFKPSFWRRHSTLINFWLDVTLLVLFLLQAWMFAVIHVVFPRGAGSNWTVWGATLIDWSETLMTTFCLFAIGIVLHLMLHWAWICGVVATRLLGRKALKDDGTQTLIGVGLIILLVHLLFLGIVAGKLGLRMAT